MVSPTLATRVPVAVIGASLAGVAVANRLALAGHRVVIFERSEVLDLRAPAVIDLPAAWRDSFRKSGRPLDTELADTGHQWVPTGPTRYADEDAEFFLPHSRAEQRHVLTVAVGAEAAREWEDFLDRTDQVWQALRPLGVEAELSTPRLSRSSRQAIGWRRTLADRAQELQHRSLAPLVTSLAVEQGTTARRLPGWYATRHSLRRTFGRWQIVDAQGQPDNQVLARLMLRRLDKRGVEVRTGQHVDAPSMVDPGDLDAAAVVDTTGGNRVDWHGRRTWQTLRATSVGDRRYVAGALTRAGSEPWAQLMSAALAAYAVHRDRTGEDIRPIRKDTPRRRLI